MRRVLAGAVWSLLPALLFAQSLGDVAKKEKERRRDNDAPVRSFTNEDVSAPDEPSGDDSAGSAPEAPTAESLDFPLQPAANSTTAAPPFSVPFGDGGNPSPLGEEKIVEVPEGDETPPTEVGGLRMKRAHEVDFQSTRPRNPPA